MSDSEDDLADAEEYYRWEAANVCIKCQNAQKALAECGCEFNPPRCATCLEIELEWTKCRCLE